MKIVCGSCQAKYSIADEKVAGKVFKIRCKRCGEVIVVRGDQEVESAAAAAPAYDAGADAIWHVVINGEQAGPYAPSQLGEMLTAGHLDWEAYVWCEGFDNWLPMRDVPDLVAAITGQGQEQAEHTAAYQPAHAQPSMGADPFADDGGGGGGMFVEPAPAASRSNLFGGAQESPFGGAGQVVASAPSPRVSVEQAMTGQRNENSVLFSLKNLQALATGSSTTAAAAPAASPGLGNRAGYAGGEGSGLIDIRALASATGVGDNAREEAEKDALLSLGSAQTGAFGALGSPMLAPAGSDDGGGNKGLYAAVFGGFVVLAGAVIAVALIMRPQAAVQAPTVAPIMPPPSVAAAAAPGAAPAAAEPPSEGELAAKRAAAASGGEAEKRSGSGNDKGSRSGGGKHRESAGSDKGSSTEGAIAAKSAAPARSDEPAPKPAAAKARGGSSSIDELLDGAIGGSGKAPAKKAAPAAEADSNLPEKPTREDVLASMNSVKDAVSACANGQNGVAFANITVSGKSGRVSGAEITGITGEAGSCIARAVRKATFPKFKSDTFQVKFPFRL
jgi:predicted Zn finger-like uncharacterized protein